MNSNILYADIGLFLISVFISSFAQVLLKQEARKTHRSRVREYLNLRVLLAYVLIGMSTLAAIYTYKSVPLSMGPVLETTGYVYITIFGAVIFKEKVNARKALALLLIIAGIAIYSVFGG